jgi:hypothetical protein
MNTGLVMASVCPVDAETRRLMKKIQTLEEFVAYTQGYMTGHRRWTGQMNNPYTNTQQMWGGLQNQSSAAIASTLGVNTFYGNSGTVSTSTYGSQVVTEPIAGSQKSWWKFWK